MYGLWTFLLKFVLVMTLVAVVAYGGILLLRKFGNKKNDKNERPSDGGNDADDGD